MVPTSAAEAQRARQSAQVRLFCGDLVGAAAILDAAIAAHPT
jgi:hypothetical protein